MSKIVRETRRGPVIARSETFGGPRRSEKYWVLVPLALIAVMVLVMIETTALNLFTAPPNLALEQIVDIPLAGGPSRFDYQSLDTRTGLLFIAHSGANMLTVFNTRSKTVVANISNIPHVHGVLAIAELGRVYATDTDDNLVYVVNEHSMRVTTTIPVGDGPDGLAYDSATHNLYISDEGGHSDTVIDVLAEKQVDIIQLGGEAGNTQYDVGSQRVFVAVQTLDQLVAIDPATRQVHGRFPLPGCDHDHGLYIDAVQRLAFVACDGNAVLLMVDLINMKVLSTQSVGKNPDVLALDSGRHYLYVASESGTVSVFDEHGRTMRKVAEGFVATGAHSISVDPGTHSLYFPLADVNSQPVLRVAQFGSPI
jgi:YVTN family beta-propeller protein